MRAGVIQGGTEIFWSPHCFEGMARRVSKAPQLGTEDANWDATGIAGAQPACSDPAQPGSRLNARQCQEMDPRGWAYLLEHPPGFLNLLRGTIPIPPGWGQ